MFRIFLLLTCFAFGLGQKKQESIFDVLELENLQIGSMFSGRDCLLPARSANDDVWYSMLPLRFEYRLEKDYFRRNMQEYFDECMIDLDSLGRIKKIGLVKMRKFDYMRLVQAEQDVDCSSMDFVGFQDTLHINKCTVRDRCVTVVHGQSKNFMVIHECSGPLIN